MNDFVIIITTNLSCEKVKAVLSNAHSSMGMIKCPIGFTSPLDEKRQLYLAHVRSIVECCSPMCGVLSC